MEKYLSERQQEKIEQVNKKLTPPFKHFGQKIDPKVSKLGSPMKVDPNLKANFAPTFVSNLF